MLAVIVFMLVLPGNVWVFLGQGMQTNWTLAIDYTDFSSTVIAIEIAITVVWSLWYSRNKLLHGGKKQSVEELVTCIRGHCSELETLFRSLNHPHPHTAVRWVPPAQPNVKVNVDVSFSLAENKSSSGVVVHNGEGQIMGSCHRTNYHIRSVFVGSYDNCSGIAVRNGFGTPICSCRK